MAFGAAAAATALSGLGWLLFVLVPAAAVGKGLAAIPDEPLLISIGCCCPPRARIAALFCACRFAFAAIRWSP